MVLSSRRLTWPLNSNGKVYSSGATSISVLSLLLVWHCVDCPVIAGTAINRQFMGGSGSGSMLCLLICQVTSTMGLLLVFITQHSVLPYLLPAISEGVENSPDSSLFFKIMTPFKYFPQFCSCVPRQYIYKQGRYVYRFFQVCRLNKMKKNAIPLFDRKIHSLLESMYKIQPCIV